MKATKAQARKMIEAHNVIMTATAGTGLHAQLTQRTIREEVITACKRAGIEIDFEDGTLTAFVYEVRA